MMGTRTCEGSGRRTQRTGSAAFPEVACPVCGYEARPVFKHGEVLIRAHRERARFRKVVA